ncbi:hypothetical protein SAMN02745163_00516 [Clostridium cavendishii DSM 21758]|uniref:Uncharacterized protein n=1 Tax=Clostridium cavendishii DSM 21758 TaxID=1121302 RepID=A0A1M6CP61_9CLOT|nr:hypothetical protein [Clostridium cavendishii]SHI62797.1 hypothetical protein SAMN02745163_00516 [Clostridium cavendishii DSM 21758]
MLNIKVWDEKNECVFSRKVWGKFKGEEFLNHNEEEVGDLAITWCMYNETACTYIGDEKCEALKQIANDYGCFL